MTQSSVDIEGGSWCRRHCHTEPVIEASKERGIGFFVPFFHGEKLWDLRSSWINWVDDGVMIINHWFSHFGRYCSMVTTK